MRKVSTLTMSLTLFAVLAGGCSTHRTTTQEVAYDSRGQPVTVQRETTTTTDSSGETGVVSGTFNVIGEVIALPFRAVGGLIRAIF